MTTSYKQFFWTIAADTTVQPEDIGSKKRAQLHKAAWDLNSIPSILLAVAGGGTAQDHPEISLTFPVETHSTAERFTDRIRQALANHGFYANPSLQRDTRFYTLDESDEERVKTAVSFREDKSEEMWRLIDSAHSAHLPSLKIINPFVANASQTMFSASASAAGAGAANSADSSFTVTPETYSALKQAHGDTIRTTTERIYNAIQSLKDETRPASVTLKMVLGGLVTVGFVMYEAFVAVAGATVAVAVSTVAGASMTFGAAALAAVGGTVGIAISVGVILVMIAIRYLGMKDVVNDLLFANDSQFAIIFDSEHIENGERAFKTDKIPARVNLTDGAPAAYPCGAFVYRKHREIIGPIGFYGSLFGIRFRAEKHCSLTLQDPDEGQDHPGPFPPPGHTDIVAKTDQFSVGMDCPNSAFGGNNSIYCGTGSATAASNGAKATGDEGDDATTTHGKITGRRADGWGNVNYGVAFFESTA
ncbi:hypothetical protein BJ138DRAFT_1104817 [Hygrophoropsis aurantiaca]|uniref:Uncharacterized protein n=1 Tax=Hygrophoropsis aurantiaca TaxID=72124 RepID=A0ACB8A0S6_9AGAM|nr:hypothetical protein BJ138DRAFT_1104817 [Hygrophoropsis aurantiaca]